MDVGFIGTGSIGAPMAASILKAGFPLVVHDITEAHVAGLLNEGATWASSPAALAERCDVICTCLPGPPEMEAVTLGPNGVVEGARAGAVLVDHTTSSPELARKVHDVLKGRGVDMLDAPVSGGREGALVRDLLIIVGGDAAVVERCRPVLDAIGERIMHVGDIGAGCTCKILHNTASFCTDLAMAECWTLAVKAGVTPEAIVTVFREGLSVA